MPGGTEGAETVVAADAPIEVLERADGPEPAAESPPVRVGPSRRAVITGAAIVGLVHAVGVYPGMRNGIFHPDRWTGPEDYSTHAWAATWVFPQWNHPVIPHFLLHLLSRMASALMGTDDYGRGMLAVLTVLVFGFAALVFAYFVRAMGTWRGRAVIPVAAACALAVSFAESPTTLLGWSYLNPPAPYFLPFNMVQIPTSFGGRVVGFGLFLLVVRTLDARPPTRWHRVGLPLVALASEFMKPSLAPTLLAVAVAWAVLHRGDERGRERLRDVLVGFALPVAAAMVWQLRIMATQMPTADNRRTLVFDPLHDLRLVEAWHPVFWGLLLFPLVATVLFRRELRGSLELTLATGCFVLSGLIITLFSLRSGSPYVVDLLQFFHSAVLLLTVVLIGRLLHLAPSLDAGGRRRLALAAMSFVPYVVGGIGVWACQGPGVCLVH